MRTVGDLGRSAMRFGAMTFLSGSMRARQSAASGDVRGMLVKPPEYWAGHGTDDLGDDVPRTGDAAYDRMVAARLRQQRSRRTAPVQRGLPSTVHRRSVSSAGPMTGPGGTARRLTPAPVLPPPNPANAPSTVTTVSTPAPRRSRNRSSSHRGRRDDGSHVAPAIDPPVPNIRNFVALTVPTAVNATKFGTPDASVGAVPRRARRTVRRLERGAAAVASPQPHAAAVLRRVSIGSAVTSIAPAERRVPAGAQWSAVARLPVSPPAPVTGAGEVAAAKQPRPSRVGGRRGTAAAQPRRRRSSAIPKDAADRLGARPDSASPTTPGEPGQPGPEHVSAPASSDAVDPASRGSAGSSAARDGSSVPVAAARASEPRLARRDRRVSVLRSVGLLRSSTGIGSLRRVPVTESGAAAATNPGRRDLRHVDVTHLPVGGATLVVRDATDAIEERRRTATSAASRPVSAAATSGTAARSGHAATSSRRARPAAAAPASSSTTATPGRDGAPSPTSRSTIKVSVPAPAHGLGDATGSPHQQAITERSGATASAPVRRTARVDDPRVLASKRSQLATRTTFASLPRIEPLLRRAGASPVPAASTAVDGSTPARSRAAGAVPPIARAVRGAAAQWYRPSVVGSAAVLHAVGVARRDDSDATPPLAGRRDRRDVADRSVRPGRSARPAATPPGTASIADARPGRRPGRRDAQVASSRPTRPDSTDRLAPVIPIDGRRAPTATAPTSPASDGQATVARPTRRVARTGVSPALRSAWPGGLAAGARRALSSVGSLPVAPPGMIVGDAAEVATSRPSRHAAAPGEPGSSTARVNRGRRRATRRSPIGGVVERSAFAAAALPVAPAAMRTSSARAEIDQPGLALPGRRPTVPAATSPPRSRTSGTWRASASTSASAALAAAAATSAVLRRTPAVSDASAGAATTTRSAGSHQPVRPPVGHGAPAVHRREAAAPAAQRFADVQRALAERGAPADRPVSLPHRFRPLAERIVGRRHVDVRLASGPATARALTAAGHAAATTGRVIHLPARPDGSTRSMAIVAHELAHVAAAGDSPVPRFHGGVASAEERVARRTEGIVRRLARAGTTERGPRSPGTADLPVAAIPSLGRMGSAPAADIALGGAGPASGGAASLDVVRRSSASHSSHASQSSRSPASGGNTSSDTIRRAVTDSDAGPVSSIVRNGSILDDSGANTQTPALSPAQLAAIIRAVEDRLLEELERRGGLRRGGF